jgi:hypothetical protein
VRLAWFRPAESRASIPLTDALSAVHDLDLYTRANAHDFVWTHVRAPYQLCVFELDNTTAHAFVWPYLLHYGGVLLLTSSTLHDSRSRALVETGRREDYEAEFLFNEGRLPRPANGAPLDSGWSYRMLRVPLIAARVTVVPHGAVADLLRNEYPDARIVHAPLAVRPAGSRPQGRTAATQTVTFGILADDRLDVARRALDRAHRLGAAATLVTSASAECVTRDADVVLVLAWPPGGEVQQLARAALAEGLPVAALETTYTADWPALNPQTWRSRSLAADPPIAVTIDPRDEEHSLVLTMRRLSADAALRSQLGEAARAWWQAHEGIAVTLDAWQHLLQDAARFELPAKPPDWPAHLTSDGTEPARQTLREFGVTVDLF